MSLNRIDEHVNANGIAVFIAGDNKGEGRVQAATTVTPGMVVTRGTAAGDIIPDNGTGKASGWASDNVSADDPAVGTAKTLRTDYAAGKNVIYYYNNGDVFMGLVASGQTLTKDQLLMTSAGKLVAFSGTDASKAVARVKAEAGTGGALGADGYVLCKWGA